MKTFRILKEDGEALLTQTVSQDNGDDNSENANPESQKGWLNSEKTLK